MAYTKNPHIPKVRKEAIRLLRQEQWSTRQVARHLGVSQSVIVKWHKKAPKTGWCEIETKSSRPHSHPRVISQVVEDEMVRIRLLRNECAEVVHTKLSRQGHKVSLSTVKRVLERRGLIKKRSKWKKYHKSGERPVVDHPGNLIEIDNIHIMQTKQTRMYITTVIDVFSRWAYAKAVQRINCRSSLGTTNTAMARASFLFQCIQTDHGSEFSTNFTNRLKAKGIRHRHSRVRQPNDNAHVERFNRTIQECLTTEIRQFRHNPDKLQHHINDWLKYYNTERPHMGLDMKTPQEVLEVIPRY